MNAKIIKFNYFRKIIYLLSNLWVVSKLKRKNCKKWIVWKFKMIWICKCKKIFNSKNLLENHIPYVYYPVKAYQENKLLKNNKVNKMNKKVKYILKYFIIYNIF